MVDGTPENRSPFETNAGLFVTDGVNERCAGPIYEIVTEKDEQGELT